MNLEDVLDPVYGLQQDEWSLSKPTFGDEGQLEVIGWSGKRAGKSDKLYILKCNKCSQDTELFGDGVFRSLKGHLVRGQVPCGCSRSPRWSKEQFHILCSRKAIELGYTFLGLVGEWKGQNTKIKMLCEKHGGWSSGNINTLINKDTGCPGCRVEACQKANTKPDNVMITSFFSSGAFHPDTKFWRSNRLKSDGYKGYWFMQCPECGETRESHSGNLQKGYRPCACGEEARRIATIKSRTKPDEVMIASFLKTGAFHRGTKFWRSARLNSNGAKVYWFMECPECKGTGESASSKFQRGQRPCACSVQRQQECYINWIVDGDSKVAIKFGIARDSKQRVKQQNSKAAYEVQQYQVYKFPDVASCKQAERECKKELDCGIILKRDMPDGYSETTWIYNLSKIQDIYKRNGGELV